MFNLGSDDKKELQENMKEIKSLIDGKQEKQESSDDLDFGSNQGDENQAAPSLGNQNQGNTGQNSQSPPNNSNNLGSDMGGQGRSNQGRAPNKPENSLSNQQINQSNQSGDGFMKSRSNQDGANNQQSNLDRDQNNDNVLSEKEVRNQKSEEKSENKERDEEPVKEPLFLREEQFTEIREMIEEMSYLSQEMGQKVDSMKKTVRNERDISKDSEELVQAFNQRRAKIESTINSGQK